MKFGDIRGDAEIAFTQVFEKTANLLKYYQYKMVNDMLSANAHAGISSSMWKREIVPLIYNTGISSDLTIETSNTTFSENYQTITFDALAATLKEGGIITPETVRDDTVLCVPNGVQFEGMTVGKDNSGNTIYLSTKTGFGPARDGETYPVNTYRAEMYLLYATTRDSDQFVDIKKFDCRIVSQHQEPDWESAEVHLYDHLGVNEEYGGFWGFLAANGDWEEGTGKIFAPASIIFPGSFSVGSAVDLDGRKHLRILPPFAINLSKTTQIQIVGISFD